MGDSSEANGALHDSGAIKLTGKIMMLAIMVLFLVVVFVFFLHLYAKRFWYLRDEDDESTTTTTTRRRRRRFEFAPSAVAAVRPGLDQSLLKSLPTITFNPKDFTDGLECAVCLSDLADGEIARILPKCNHGFHVDCIDMWFQSHTTCPICRDPVSNQSPTAPDLTQNNPPRTGNSSSIGVLSTESMNFPTNVLFWGNQNQVSTLNSSLENDPQGGSDSSQLPTCSSSSSSSNGNRGDGMLVIDIPNQIAEDDEQKSPMITPLRSLRRLLSRNMMSPRSPTIDAEQIGRIQS